MEKNSTLGQQIKNARHQQKVSQVEFADKCHLNIRTVQRIASDETRPRFYTLKLMEKVLKLDLNRDNDSGVEKEQIRGFRTVFERRKRLRKALFYAGLVVLFLALILVFSGLPKLTWAPFFYLFFFADFIAIGLTWRCPGCNGLLGDVFNVRYCSKCGLDFYDES